MVVREKNCYYAIALTDFFVFLSCAEIGFIKNAFGRHYNITNYRMIKLEIVSNWV